MTDLTDIIQQVKRANDIVDVIGPYLDFGKKALRIGRAVLFTVKKRRLFA